MPYQWTLDPQDLFTERYPQMVNTGLPVEDADAMRDSITEMWANEPGGWVFEWSQLAARYGEEGDDSRAALAYGWAKFPTLADDFKRRALELQLEHYLVAAGSFPVEFDRRILEVPYRGSSTSVPVHLLAAPDLPDDAPVLLASGGVDSWKMDLHAMFVGFALSTGTRVLAFDIPGTGESSSIALGRESIEMVEGLIAQARTLGDGRVAHLGISMGGYFSAATGLAGEVDAAIVLGGPVDTAFAPDRSFQSAWPTSSATPSDSTTRPARPRSPAAAARCPCADSSRKTATRRCSSSTGRRTSTSPRPTRSSSAAAGRPTWSCSPTPDTAPYPSSTRSCRR
jgi:esterase FrsA